VAIFVVYPKHLLFLLWNLKNIHNFTFGIHTNKIQVGTRHIINFDAFKRRLRFCQESFVCKCTQSDYCVRALVCIGKKTGISIIQKYRIYTMDFALALESRV